MIEKSKKLLQCVISVLGPLSVRPDTWKNTARRHGQRRTTAWRCGGEELPEGSSWGSNRSLVFDLSIAHDRFGSSSHVHQNGSLSHPQDLDGPMRVAAQRKTNAYKQTYTDNQNISFLPAIMSTSNRMHGEFYVFFFYRPTGRPKRTSLPLECHRNAINRNHFGSSARHSTKA